MSVAPSTSGLTWEEFLNLPDDDRYKHTELVGGELVYKYGPPADGELILVNPPVWLHQHVVSALVAMIWNWIRAGAGRGSVTMEPPVQVLRNRGYLPDVAWFREERSRPASGNPYLSGAPDLAVEVLSPSTRAVDMIRKWADYARVGVRELWLIDPDEPTVFMLRLLAEPTDTAEFVQVDELRVDGVLTSPLLPGLQIPVRDLLP